VRQKQATFFWFRQNRHAIAKLSGLFSPYVHARTHLQEIAQAISGGKADVSVRLHLYTSVVCCQRVYADSYATSDNIILCTDTRVDRLTPYKLANPTSL
jgi:hypothetical protein